MSIFEWTSDTGRTRTNFADQVRIELHFIEDLSASEPIEDWIITSSGSAWEEDWLILEVEKIVHDGYLDPSGDWKLAGPLYDATITRRRLNWGADASFFTILIDLSVGLIGAAIWDSIKSLSHRMADKLRQHNELHPAPLTENEAFERAKWLLSQRYKKDADTLFLLSIEATDGAVSIVIEDDDGVTYACVLVIIDGLVDIVRIRRQFPR